MQSQSTDLQRNNVLPEIYIIICEIFQVKNGWFRTFCILKGHFEVILKKRLPEAKPNLPKRED